MQGLCFYWTSPGLGVQMHSPNRVNASRLHAATCYMCTRISIVAVYHQNSEGWVNELRNNTDY